MGYINRIVSRPLDAGTNMPPPRVTGRLSPESLNRAQRRLMKKYPPGTFDYNPLTDK